MNIYNQFILENALTIKNSHLNHAVMKLFKPSKWPYEGSFPFIDNIFLAIKYSSVNFV